MSDDSETPQTEIDDTGGAKVDDILPFLAIALAMVVSVSMGSGASTSWDLIVGLIFGCCLAFFGPQRVAKRLHLIPIAMVWGFCGILLCGFLIDILYLQIWDGFQERLAEQPPPNWSILFDDEHPLWLRHWMHAAGWVVATLIASAFLPRIIKM